MGIKIMSYMYIYIHMPKRKMKSRNDRIQYTRLRKQTMYPGFAQGIAQIHVLRVAYIYMHVYCMHDLKFTLTILQLLYI